MGAGPCKGRGLHARGMVGMGLILLWLGKKMQQGMWNGYHALQGRGGWTCCPLVCNQGNAGACFLGVPRGLFHHCIEGDRNQAAGQGVFGALGWLPSPVLTQCSGESPFPAPSL